jgi:pSer/pThr/pTyr-binding forkhead associated (FHA) protein
VFRPSALILFFAFVSVAAAQTATLKFDSAAPREVWVAANPQALPVSPKASSEATFEVDTKGAPATNRILVRDTTTGNLAVVPLAGGAVRAADFKLVDQVNIAITSGGQPVAAAMLAAVAPNGKFPQVLDPSTDGIVSFRGLAPGSIKITVNYRSNGATATPVRQEFDLALTRTEPVPQWSIALPSPATVVGATAAPAAEPKKTEKPISTGSPFGTVLQMLLGLGVVAGLGYLGYRYAQQNPGPLAAKLEQLGVQIPKPGDAPLTTADPVPVAPTPPPPPPQKIVLDPVAADPIAPIAVAAPVITGEPKLVAANGDAVLLSQGSTVVGREIGVGISLVDETTLSRRHAEVTRNGDSITVADLGSTNGTYVNGVKLTSAVTLRPGDQVQFGAVRFRYEG